MIEAAVAALQSHSASCLLRVDKVPLILSVSKSLAEKMFKTALHGHRSLTCRNSLEFFPYLETWGVFVR